MYSCIYPLKDLTVGQFIYVIRKKIKLSPDKAIFVYVNSVLPASSASMHEIHAVYKDDDGFLYLTYSGENSFYVWQTCLERNVLDFSMICTCLKILNRQIVF